jgi:hypothetical protein
MNTRAALTIMAVGGTLLAGCTPRTAANATRPAPAVNPRLPGIATRLSAATSAASVAHTIANGWAALDAPAGGPGIVITFTSVDYIASVFNPDLASGFTAFLTLRRHVTVTPTSAAVIDTTNDAPPVFATSTDRTLWVADNRPSLGQAPSTGQRMAVPAGEFSFMPQGSTLTYGQAAALPGEPDQLVATVLDHLRPYAGPHPPASLQLKQLGYLIATAPLTNSARVAVWEALASLPGLHTCGPSLDPARADVIDMCIDTPTVEETISVDTSTGAIVSIAERLLRPSRLYPHVQMGANVDSSTFVAG